MAAVMSASASLYNFTFAENNNGPTVAFGQLDIVNDIAISGFITVNSGPQAPITLPLWPGSGTMPGSLNYDNRVDVDSSQTGTWIPAYTSYLGLAFWTGVSGSVELNMWCDGPSQYTLYGFPPQYSPTAIGDSMLTPVPEPTTMIAGALLLVPFGASTLRMLRRRTA
jgi:hypothetical protein